MVAVRGSKYTIINIGCGRADLIRTHNKKKKKTKKKFTIQ